MYAHIFYQLALHVEMIPEVAYNLNNNEISNISIQDASYDLVHPFLSRLAERVNVPKGKVISFIQSAYDSQPTSPTNAQSDEPKSDNANLSSTIIEGLDEGDNNTSTFITAVSHKQASSPKASKVPPLCASVVTSPCNSTNTNKIALSSSKQEKIGWKKLLSPKSKNQPIPSFLELNDVKSESKVYLKPTAEKGASYNLVSGGKIDTDLGKRFLSE
jgi:hypothetical protein